MVANPQQDFVGAGADKEFHVELVLDVFVQSKQNQVFHQ